MKYTISLLLLLLLITNSFAKSINTPSFDDRELIKANEIINQSKKISTKEFYSKGAKLAKQQKQKGIRRVLILSGPFDNSCMTCIYHKFRFSTYDFGSNDIFDENRNAFIEGYNHEMTSSLSKEEVAIINNGFKHKKAIFNFSTTTIHQINATLLNDSVLNIKIKSDSLESLFKIEIKHVIVEFKRNQNDEKLLTIGYNELKNHGIDLPIDFVVDNKLFIVFDLSKIPNNYDICWCDCINQRFYMTFPLRFDEK